MSRHFHFCEDQAAQEYVFFVVLFLFFGLRGLLRVIHCCCTRGVLHSVAKLNISVQEKAFFGISCITALAKGKTLPKISTSVLISPFKKKLQPMFMNF